MLTSLRLPLSRDDLCGNSLLHGSRINFVIRVDHLSAHHSPRGRTSVSSPVDVAIVELLTAWLDRPINISTSVVIGDEVFIVFVVAIDTLPEQMRVCLTVFLC